LYYTEEDIMTINSFLKLVEIQTKVASMTPFLLGTVFTLYYFETFNPTNFIIMLGSLLCIDMATTAINNYIDYKKAIKKHGFGYESHNAIVKYQLKEGVVISTILILLIIAMTLGVILFLNTNWVVLLLGAISFVIGVLYSFGPVPISRTPFGELFSGGFMGLIIPFIAIYIHVYEQGIIDMTYLNEQLTLTFDILKVGSILLISIPLAVGIANIMLANNICDIEDDIENKRYTLPIYIGKTPALWLYTGLYIFGYLSVVLAVIFKILPLVSLLALLTIIPVSKHIQLFMKIQTKKDTFVLTVKNFVIINIPLIITIVLGIMIK
jgi:1,4-dihydroxy-2-naphthoate polyprenyltransferase